MQPNNSFSFGGAPGPSFQPQNILYYKLNVLTNSSSNVGDWEYEYPICGLYAGTNIAQFIELIISDDLPALSPTSDDPLNPPDITITDQCYVVMKITSDKPTLRYRDGVPALKTVDDHQDQYRRLSHVDQDGNMHIGSSTSNCSLIYFAVRNVAEDEDHPYNIYVQYQDGPAIIQAVIDPAIKNRGGDD